MQGGNGDSSDFWGSRHIILLFFATFLGAVKRVYKVL